MVWRELSVLRGTLATETITKFNYLWQFLFSLDQFRVHGILREDCKRWRLIWKEINGNCEDGDGLKVEHGHLQLERTANARFIHWEVLGERCCIGSKIVADMVGDLPCACRRPFIINAL